MDDNKVIRQLIRVNLELEGLEVVTAADGAECLDVVHAVRPDVVTLDVVMPRLDGLRTAARLRADPRTHHLPLAIISACSQYEVETGLDVGVDAFLAKPFEPTELVRLVKQLLERRIGPGGYGGHAGREGRDGFGGGGLPGSLGVSGGSGGGDRGAGPGGGGSCGGPAGGPGGGMQGGGGEGEVDRDEGSPAHEAASVPDVPAVQGTASASVPSVPSAQGSDSASGVPTHQGAASVPDLPSAQAAAPPQNAPFPQVPQAAAPPPNPPSPRATPYVHPGVPAHPVTPLPGSSEGSGVLDGRGSLGGGLS